MQQKTIKILLVQITNKNYGDSVIADNTRYLLHKAIPRVSPYAYEIFDYAVNTEDLAQIAYVDAVVFAGGGLVKFRQEMLYRQVSELIMEAQNQGVPVFLNAVGVEGFDAADPRCQQLQTALNQPCVKMISVRDDIACLKAHYLRGSSIRVREVFDPAVWSQKTYGISRPAGQKMGYIGLGVARETLFTDYGTPEVDAAYLLEFWKEVAEQLEQNGYRWKIFTNGLDKDEAFAGQVLAAIGHGEKLPQVRNAKELVEEIARMDGMIACRMHANIIAYSLGIASIGLVWNDKMKFWGQKSGCSARYLSYPDLKADTVVRALQQALREKPKKPSWWNRRSTYREIRRFVRVCCKPRPKETPDFAVADHLVATALGGCAFKYKNMNTVAMLNDSVQKGYRYLELDVRFSSDEILLCVNGWGKGTLRALGQDESRGALDAQTFAACRYYGCFKTDTFAQMLEAFAPLAQNDDMLTLILDVGKPQRDVQERYFVQLVQLLRQYHIPEKQILVRLQRESDVRLLDEQGYACGKIYYLSPELAQKETTDAQYRKVVRFCRKNKIKYISMSDQAWSKAVQEKLTEDGLEALVLSYSKVGDILYAWEHGAGLTGSYYYDAAYIRRLLQ